MAKFSVDHDLFASAARSVKGLVVSELAAWTKYECTSNGHRVFVARPKSGKVRDVHFTWVPDSEWVTDPPARNGAIRAVYDFDLVGLDEVTAIADFVRALESMAALAPEPKAAPRRRAAAGPAVDPEAEAARKADVLQAAMRLVRGAAAPESQPTA